MKKKTKHLRKRHCGPCPAICCTNLALAIGKPVNQAEVEDLKWQLHFDTIKVYVLNRHWYQWVEGRCMYLSKNNKCNIYAHRPDKCRKHNPPNCENHGSFYDIMFSTPDELEKYLKLEKIKRIKRRRKFSD